MVTAARKRAAWQRTIAAEVDEAMCRATELKRRVSVVIWVEREVDRVWVHRALRLVEESERKLVDVEREVGSRDANGEVVPGRNRPRSMAALTAEVGAVSRALGGALLEPVR